MVGSWKARKLEGLEVKGFDNEVNESGYRPLAWRKIDLAETS
jgi:hypothetical protein